MVLDAHSEKVVRPKGVSAHTLRAAVLAAKLRWDHLWRKVVHCLGVLWLHLASGDGLRWTEGQLAREITQREEVRESLGNTLCNLHLQRIAHSVGATFIRSRGQRPCDTSRLLKASISLSTVALAFYLSMGFLQRQTVFKAEYLCLLE